MLLEAECRDQINAVSEGEGKWYRIEAVRDTGATQSVIAPNEVPSVPIQDSLGSKAGQVFTSASGGRMPNQGQKMFAVESNEGDQFSMTYQVADVQKGLTSVGSICDSGDGENFVVFTRTGGYIASPQLGTTTKFSRTGKGAPYLMTQWVNRQQPGFGRQG